MAATSRPAADYRLPTSVTLELVTTVTEKLKQSMNK